MISSSIPGMFFIFIRSVSKTIIGWNSELVRALTARVSDRYVGHGLFPDATSEGKIIAFSDVSNSLQSGIKTVRFVEDFETKLKNSFFYQVVRVSHTGIANIDEKNRIIVTRNITDESGLIPYKHDDRSSFYVSRFISFPGNFLVSLNCFPDICACTIKGGLFS